MAWSYGGNIALFLSQVAHQGNIIYSCHTFLIQSDLSEFMLHISMYVCMQENLKKLNTIRPYCSRAKNVRKVECINIGGNG